MKNSIKGNQFGKTINVFINGKLSKKVCDTLETSTAFFALIMDAKGDSTD